MILITSAAGQTGTRLIRQLVTRGQAVRGLVRGKESADRVAALGAEPIIGDLRDAAALDRALRGVEKLYYIAPSLSSDEHAMGRGVIDAARRARLGHFVLHGVIAPYLSNISYHRAKECVQLDLYRSGLPYTVLSPTNFMQNVSWTWPSIVERSLWELPYSIEQRLTWVDLDDVAEAVAIVLTEPGHTYATYELVGTDAFLSRSEIAAMMSDVLGRTIRAERVDVDDYLEEHKSQPIFRNSSATELDQIRAMFLDYDAHGMPAGNSRVLSMLLSRPAGSYRDFLSKLGGALRNPAAVGGITSYGLPDML